MSEIKHLDAVESLIGKSENDDYTELRDAFESVGIDCGDIRKDTHAWCGMMVRYAILKAGLPDGGDILHRASNWQHYGLEATDPNEPGTIVVYYSHVSIRTRDGGEIGGNVGDSVKVMPAGQNWFGTPIAYRQPLTPVVDTETPARPDTEDMLACIQHIRNILDELENRIKDTHA